MSWINSARPNARTRASAYTHKLDFELDTAVHVFKRLPEGRWLRGLELETSLDYLATGLPKKGDVFSDGSRFLDDASHWSFSFVDRDPDRALLSGASFENLAVRQRSSISLNIIPPF